MKNQIDKSRSLVSLLPVCSVALSIPVLFTSIAHAAPSGANVVSGNVNISQSSSTMARIML